MTQTVVITGASAGIGRATARLYGERGANVALIARGQAGLDGAVRDVEDGGGKALAISADVADFAQVQDAARQAEEFFGPIDVWINDAFTSVFSPFAEISAEEFRRVTEVSYLGFVHGTMAALALMRPRGQGTIVQVGSALGSRSIPLQSAYCGAKHAINGFTSSLRCELLHEGSGVHVTVAQMPAVNTPQFSWVRSRLPRDPQPVPPIYQPEMAARGVLFAADHPRRRQYWVGATTAVPGPHRLRLPADRPAGGRPPAGQPVPAARRPGRPGPRRARDLRHQVARAQRATVAGRAPARAGRPGRGRCGRHRARGDAAGPAPVRAVTCAPGSLLQVVRAGYGGALLIVPGPVIRLATGRPAGARARAGARVLGARHLLQVALTAAAASSAGSLGLGAAVDLAHAASMAALGLADRQVRRLTLSDALVESTFAVAGASAARAG
jgi:NAD(P)-dependent dehydrogenase (short-subunit alcohol dehydrogenase family)